MSRFSSVISDLIQLKDKFLPKTLIESDGSSVSYQEFYNGVWQTLPAVSKNQSVFSQRILLIPDELTFFRLRHFPADVVSKQALKEAVELDLPRWVPWQEDLEFFYWPKRSGDNWHVAVWVWQKADLAGLLDCIDVIPTHIVPKIAIRLATLQTEQDSFIYIDSLAPGKWNFVHVNQDFSILNIVEVANSLDANRFCKSVGGNLRAITLLADDLTGLEELFAGEQSNITNALYGLPDRPMLSYARQSGVSDWSDPFVWAKPLGALMSLYILWLLGTGVVLLKQGKELSSYIADTSSSSIELLDRRENVERIEAIAGKVSDIRGQQIEFELVLAALSIALPKNAWLEYVEYNSDDGGWLDISGKSEQSAGLAAELEKMPEVEQALFLNDIRKDQRTGLEPFKIRLKLQQAGS